MALSALQSVCELLRPFLLHHHTSRPCFPNPIREGINTPIVVHITKFTQFNKNSVIPHGMRVGIQRLGGVG